ncbi:unnamed protein product [Amaranthus hypochondriacus]
MLPLSFVGAPVQMTKRRWRDLMQALYANHFDPKKDEELKQSKIDLENKLPKILKLVKERRNNSRKNRNSEANLRKESELIELIEDFHKHYQFVYDQYDDLREHLSQTVNGAKEDEGYFTAATSSSDSETESDVDESIHISVDKESLMNKIEENEKIIENLKEIFDKKGREISSLAEKQKLCVGEISGLVKKLESELVSVNVKLDGMWSGEKAVEQRMENEELQDQACKLEARMNEINDGISRLVTTNGTDGVIEVDVSVFEAPELKELVLQVKNLKQNADWLINARKNETKEEKGHRNNSSSIMHENLLDQVNKMKRDLGFMRKKNSELESNIKKKTRENLELVSQVEELRKMYKEKEGLLVRMKNVDVEVHNLRGKLSEREKLMGRKEQENFKLSLEIEVLQEKVTKMEKILKEREEQFVVLQTRLENGDDDKSAQIVALTAQINHIEQELELKNELEREIKIKNNDIGKLIEEKESLQGRISELEKKLEDKGDEFSNSPIDMSTQIVALTREVSQLQREKDMEKKLDEQISFHDQEISELGEEKESFEAKVLELEITLTEREDQIVDLQRKNQIAENELSCLQEELSVERKKFSEKLSQLENLNSELSSKVLDQQIVLKQHEETAHKLKEDCKSVKGQLLQAADRKMDEVAKEFRKNFEGKLRILSQRIRVAEQLHGEIKETSKRMQERCKQEHPGLEKKLSQFMSSGKAELRTVSRAVDEMMKGMECLITKFETKEGCFLQRLSRVSDEIQVVKNRMKLCMNEHQGSPFTLKLDEKEQDKILKEKVKRLEGKVNKEKGDKLKLMRNVYEMQKKVADLEKDIAEKDEELSRLGDEKVEAIRQLCMWIDYRQSRFDQLKEVMLVNKIFKDQGGT